MGDMNQLEREHLFLDLAKNAVWPEVLQALKEDESLVNVVAWPAHRWSALHQAFPARTVYKSFRCGVMAS